jgi:hypothetical protein
VSETKIARIKVRRGTSAQWTSTNPILLFGEVGIEDNGFGPMFYRIKIGDDSTEWNLLPYHGNVSSQNILSVDMTVAAQTSIYIVPSGAVAILSKLFVRHKTVSDPLLASPVVRLGTSSDPNVMFSGVTLSVSAVNNVSNFDLGNLAYPAGTEFQFGVTTSSGSTTHIGDVVAEISLLPA